jgi:predicted O-methyltransferase YrrM
MGVIGVYATLKPDLPYPPFGGWAISGDCARRLVELVMTVRPSSVIEAGSGLSTLLIAQALEIVGGDGRVVALEHEKQWMDRSTALLALHGMAHRADISHAPLVEIDLEGERFNWYDLSEVSLPTDAEIIFIDGPPKATGPLARYPALPLLIDRLVPGGVILLDDAHRPDEKAAVQRWQAEIPGLNVIFYSDSKQTVELRKGQA